jgi:hypothetical protein
MAGKIPRLTAIAKGKAEQAVSRFIKAELPRLETLNEPDDAAGDLDELNGFFRRYALAV